MITILTISPIFILLAIMPITVYGQTQPTTYVQVYSNDSWTGTIADSEFDSESHDGFGNTKLPFTCEDGGIYSVVFQKGVNAGSDLFVVKIVVDGEIVDEGKTTAEYGIVTLAGDC